MVNQGSDEAGHRRGLRSVGQDLRLVDRWFIHGPSARGHILLSPGGHPSLLLPVEGVPIH